MILDFSFLSLSQLLLHDLSSLNICFVCFEAMLLCAYKTLWNGPYFFFIILDVSLLDLYLFITVNTLSSFNMIYFYNVCIDYFLYFLISTYFIFCFQPCIITFILGLAYLAKKSQLKQQV